MDSTDRELLDRFCDSGDAEAFKQLVRRHGPTVLGVCRRVLRDSHDADDAFQATFLVLSRKASSIRDRTTMSHWLYKVAVHASRRLKAQRDQRRRQEEPREAWIAEQVAEGRTREVIAPVIDEEVEKLPEKVRGPIVMCCFEGKTYGEAARAMQCSEATVRGRLSRARDILRQRLERRGIAVPAGALMAGLVASRASAQVPGALAMAASSAGLAGKSAGTGALAVVGMTARAGALARDVLKGMFWAKLKLAAVPAIVAAIALTSAVPLVLKRPPLALPLAVGPPPASQPVAATRAIVETVVVSPAPAPVVVAAAQPAPAPAPAVTPSAGDAVPAPVANVPTFDPLPPQLVPPDPPPALVPEPPVVPPQPPPLANDRYAGTLGDVYANGQFEIVALDRKSERHFRVNVDRVLYNGRPARVKDLHRGQYAEVTQKNGHSDIRVTDSPPKPKQAPDANARDNKH